MTAEGPESEEAPPATDSSTAVQAPEGPSRVFVSYASRDAAVASALVETLERHGVACWIAPRDVKAGALYAEAIVRAISEAKALVLVLSERADTETEYRSALAAADEAIQFDPSYAAAYVLRTNSLLRLSFTDDLNVRSQMQGLMLVAAQRAVELSPEFGDAHLALAETRGMGLLDFGAAAPEFDRALALAPGSVLVLRNVAAFTAITGHYASAIATAQRAVTLDPQSHRTHEVQGMAFYLARRYAEALSAFQDARALRPDSGWDAHLIAETLLAMGRPEEMRQECESYLKQHVGEEWHACFALAYRALGQQADAEREFQKFKPTIGDAYGYAQLYAQFGDKAAALQWLAKAYRLRDPALQFIKGDWELDPIRDEPQFKAIMARMNFPP
jgi:tetratricopeptide (TPR) repeat protein